ncbi:cell wall hydrolase [Pseudomonas typographi]|uniref:Cell wall hydrolase n=1 Tax=Pseudomonas typographi TaxID=2715964 RepID=A0ABR7Z5M5_9PSED|nr:cell wall hydrolase [Pseudomonas typographi]MBD1600624.1 cell wall hydrolase [Pseudomonas typographi]
MRLRQLVIAVYCVSIGHGGLALADPLTATATHKAEVLEEKAASGAKASPPPASQAISPAEAQAVDPAGQAPLDDALTCLARSIYWEAKGGSQGDMEDVASVVMNRLGQAGFPGTVCGVVKQGSEHNNCQFSWWCDGRADQAEENDRYTLAKDVARKALNRQLVDRTHGAQYFHDHSVTPATFTSMVRTAQSSRFVFYRPRGEQAPGK